MRLAHAKWEQILKMDSIVSFWRCTRLPRCALPLIFPHCLLIIVIHLIRFEKTKIFCLSNSFWLPTNKIINTFFFFFWMTFEFLSLSQFSLHVFLLLLHFEFHFTWAWRIYGVWNTKAIYQFLFQSFKFSSCSQICVCGLDVDNVRVVRTFIRGKRKYLPLNLSLIEFRTLCFTSWNDNSTV